MNEYKIINQGTADEHIYLKTNYKIGDDYVYRGENMRDYFAEHDDLFSGDLFTVREEGFQRNITYLFNELGRISLFSKFPSFPPVISFDAPEIKNMKLLI